MTTSHILAVNRKIAEVKGAIMQSPYFYDLSYVKLPGEEHFRKYSPMTSWHDAGPLVEEMLEKHRYVYLESIDEDHVECKCGPGHERAGAKVLHAICYAYLCSNGVENPEQLGVSDET